jgi:hypothetical protein
LGHFLVLIFLFLFTVLANHLHRCKYNEEVLAGHQWLTPVIPATQGAEIRRIAVRSHLGQIVCEILSQKKPNTKIGLVEWLKVKALSSSPSITRTKQNKNEEVLVIS